MSRHELLGSFHIPVRNCSDDLGDLVRREINPHDCASLRDVHVRWRMIEGIDPHLEPFRTENRWQDYT